ncbi:MAG: sugar ABC transporter permease [Burkholderiales bacterium]|nr:sugar ABC transporter permease [Burkholderiales bacterium]
MKRRESTPQAFALKLALPVIAFMLVMMSYPLLYALWLSFREVSFFGGIHSDYVGLANYEKVLGSGEFWWSTGVTLRFTVETVVLAIAIGLALALVMHKVKRGSAALRTVVILPWSVSLYAAGVAWSYLARGQSGIGTALYNALRGTTTVESAVEVPFINSHWIVELLAVGNAWNMAPLVAFFLLANLQTIPTRLYDLAALDRLTVWERFVHVTLPPLRYTLFVFTSICTILSMKLLDFIFVMTAGGPGDASTTLTFKLYDLAFRQTNMGYSAAMSFFLLFMIIAATLLLYVFWGRREGAQA